MCKKNISIIGFILLLVFVSNYFFKASVWENFHVERVSASLDPIVVTPEEGQAGIVNAVATLTSAGGGEIELLSGTYVFTTPLVIDSSSISIIGAGKALTILSFSGTDGIFLDGSAGSIRYCSIENLKINGNGATGSGLKLQNAVENTFRNLYVTGFISLGKYGLEYTGTAGNNFYNQFSTCTFAGNANGALNYGQVNQFFNCRFQGNHGVGVMDFGTSPSFVGCGFEGNDSYGVNTSQNGGKSFIGCYWERNGDADLISVQTDGLLISGGRAYAGAIPSDYGFIIGRTLGTVPSGVTIQGVLFYGPHNVAAIDLIKASNVNILGNSFVNENVEIITGEVTGDVRIQSESQTVYNIGGTISGLVGTLVLKNNSDYLDLSSNGTFTFATALPYGDSYNVTVLTQPAEQSCFISSGAGIVARDDVDNIEVVCSSDSLPPFAPQGLLVQ